MKAPIRKTQRPHKKSIKQQGRQREQIKPGKPKKAEETEESTRVRNKGCRDDYFDDEEEYIEEEHPINRAYREWNDYEDEIPSPSKKPVTEEMSEKKSPKRIRKPSQKKMDVPQKNEKGMEVFDLNDL